MAEVAQILSFDEMVDFHKKDPAGFEAYRQQLLENAVAEAPESARPALNHLLFKMSQAREKAATPLEAAQAAADMLINSARDLQASFEHLAHEAAGAHAEEYSRKFMLKARAS